MVAVAAVVLVLRAQRLQPTAGRLLLAVTAAMVFRLLSTVQRLLVRVAVVVMGVLMVLAVLVAAGVD
jgi:hypothetical protein